MNDDETTTKRPHGGALTALRAIELMEQGVRYLSAILGLLDGVSSAVTAVHRLRRPGPVAAITHRRSSALGSIALLGAGLGVGLGVGVVLVKTVDHGA